MIVVGTTYIQQHGERTVMQNYLYDEDKGGREETIFLIFRWNVVVHYSYQADEIVTEIEEWKQKVLSVCVKSFSRVLKCVGDISCTLEKLYYMNPKFDYNY